VKKWLKLKEKTHLIQPYVAFICPQYMLKLLAIDMSCGAFDEFIWCVLEIMLKICSKLIKVRYELNFKKNAMLFLILCFDA
jgi:hypothetical protein